MSNEQVDGKAIPQEWHECDGEVGRLVHQLRWRRRATPVKRGALVLGILLLFVPLHYFFSDAISEIEANVTGCTCDHYMEEMRDFYCEKSRDRLDVKLWEHLSTCRDCRKTFTLYTRIARTSVARASVNGNRTHTTSPKHPISLEQLLKGATFAMEQ